MEVKNFILKLHHSVGIVHHFGMLLGARTPFLCPGNHGALSTKGGTVHRADKNSTQRGVRVELMAEMI